MFSAQRVGRQPRALGERERLVEERRPPSRCSRACSGRRRGGYSTSARSTSVKPACSTSARESASSSIAVFTSPLCARAIASPFSARTWSSGEPVPSTAGSALVYSAIASSKSCSLEQRLGAGEDRLGPGALVARDAAREEARVDAEPEGEPVDRLAASGASCRARSARCTPSRSGRPQARSASARRRRGAGARARRAASPRAGGLSAQH